VTILGIVVGGVREGVCMFTGVMVVVRVLDRRKEKEKES
jgi:hypothetical protein